LAFFLQSLQVLQLRHRGERIDRLELRNVELADDVRINRHGYGFPP
jgi:uncharacterized protein (UPF0335 family)